MTPTPGTSQDEIEVVRYGSRFVSDKKPIFVRMGHRNGFRWDEFTVDITGSEFRIRPKHTRRGGPAEVSVSVGAMYERLLVARADAARRAKAEARRKGPRRVKRGAL
jgi:hypothetical protein